MEQKISVKREMRAIPAEGHPVIDLTGFTFAGHYGETIDISSAVSGTKVQEWIDSGRVPNVDVIVNLASGLVKFKLHYIDPNETLLFIGYDYLYDSGDSGSGIDSFVMLEIWADGEAAEATLSVSYLRRTIDFESTDFTAEEVITDKINVKLFDSLAVGKPSPTTLWVWFKVNGKTVKTSSYMVRDNKIYFYCLNVGSSGVDGIVYLQIWKSGTDIKGQMYEVPFGG